MTNTIDTKRPDLPEKLAIRKVARVLRKITNKHVCEIIELLLEYEQLTVTEIYIKLRIQQAEASQSLKSLRDIGLVTTEREGKNIYYELDEKRLKQINQITKRIEKWTK